MTKNEKLFIQKALDTLDRMHTHNMSEHDLKLWIEATTIIDKALKGEDK